jgi:hypothetical protein
MLMTIAATSNGGDQTPLPGTSHRFAGRVLPLSVSGTMAITSKADIWPITRTAGNNND